MTGCVSYRPHPLSATSAAHQLQERSLAGSGLRDFVEKNAHGASPAWPLPSWDLNSLSLAAWFFNPKMGVARANLNSARADALAARQRANPGLSFSPEYTTNADAGLSPWTLGFSLDLPFETAGKRHRRAAVADFRVDAARYRLGSVAWNVRMEVRAACVRLAFAQRYVRALNGRLKDQRELVETLRAQARAGEISSADVLQAEADEDQLRQSRETAQGSERDARAELARSLGVSVDALADIHLDLARFFASPPTLPDKASLRKWALLSRSDILAGLADYRAAEAELRLQVARQYPNFHLGPGYTWDQGAKRWSLGIGLTLPVFNRNRGGIAQAEAARKASQTRFEARQAAIQGELEQAEADWRTARNRLRQADALYRSREHSEKDASARYRAGETGKIEMLSARLAADRAAFNRIQALEAVQVALSEMENAIQRPLSSVHPLPRYQLPTS